VRCDLLAPESPQWASALEGLRHDVYHLPSYAQLGAQTDGGRGMAFLAEDSRGRFLVPLILRPAPLDAEDAVSPYGYPAPIWSSDAPPDFIDEAIAAFVDTLRSRRIVSAFIRLHPLLSTALAPLRAFGDVVAGAETVYLDLTESAETLWKDTRENHRRSIRRAERSGFVARCDAEWERLDEFLLAYRETMARVEATAYYLFSDAYYVGLRRALGDRLHLLVVEQQNQVAAAALFTECCGIAQYHLGGTRDAFLPVAPMKLLFHFARAWFKDRGARLLHLGGGVGSQDDSLLHFKAGFSSKRAQFHSWRLITAPDAYRELVADWRGQHGREPRGTFFPAYREPQ
jgi:hypothetical protein